LLVLLQSFVESFDSLLVVRQHCGRVLGGALGFQAVKVGLGQLLDDDLQRGWVFDVAL